GNPSPNFIDLILKAKPEQVTLVPDADDALTSNAGWDTEANFDFLSKVIKVFKAEGIRTSVFVDPDPRMVEFAAKAGADRVELYTEPYAKLFPVDPAAAVAPFVEAAAEAKRWGIGLNAGHDLNLQNLTFFSESIEGLDEVSIGHALISDALYLGLEETVKRYKACLK
ncbi:MAG: pyridoxine 5'-phosphate synthase, partial [Bacteroidales bacterium]